MKKIKRFFRLLSQAGAYQTIGPALSICMKVMIRELEIVRDSGRPNGY